MTGSRWRLVLLVAAVALLTVGIGCPGRRPPATVPSVDGDVGLYRASASVADGTSRRFRVWLWAARPDRLHAELLTPVGGTAVILDAGGGRLAVTDVGARLSFVGDAGGDALARLLAIDLTIGELVAALLDGSRPGGEVSLEREPSLAPGLPDVIALGHGPSSLRLQLRRRVALAADVDPPGTGRPPAGFDTRPLAELGGHDLPDLDGEPR